MEDPILGFSGKHDFLSNFFLAGFWWEGIHWPTSEHAFQAAKTLDQTERERIAGLPTPGKAKRAGRQLVLRPGWESMRVAIMLDILEHKFADPDLGARLLATKDARIEETNNWGDTFWGVCDGRGINMLGQLLMMVRANLEE